MGIAGVCNKIVQVLGVAQPTLLCIDNLDISVNPKLDGLDQYPIENEKCSCKFADPTMTKALTSIFGMETNGKIKKEKARRVVENLGIKYGDQENQEPDMSGFEVLEIGLDDELPVEEVLSGLVNGSERDELLREAFRVFDENGNGFIEANELKKVLQCLGLDKGLNMCDIEKMLKLVDLNLDGRVDFSEFVSMMGNW